MQLFYSNSKKLSEIDVSKDKKCPFFWGGKIWLWFWKHCMCNATFHIKFEKKIYFKYFKMLKKFIIFGTIQIFLQI